jgi:hypothetical protein
MNITSAQYLRDVVSGDLSSIEATIDSKKIYIPLDLANRHYAAIKAKHDDPNDSFTIADAD